MRGKDGSSGSLFSYVDLEARVPRGHPLRAIRDLTNAALSEMSGEFEALYSRTGRPGIAPEKLLRALLLQAFYSIRAERQLMEQLEFNLLFRWFVGLGIDDRVWDATVFTKNRERLLAGDVASRFLAHLVSLPAVKHLLSQDHFSVDGTQIEAWASIKSFRAVDEEPADLGGQHNALAPGPCDGRAEALLGPPEAVAGRGVAEPAPATAGSPGPIHSRFDPVERPGDGIGLGSKFGSV